MYDQQVKKYLEGLGYKDFRLDLGPMQEACSLLHNPQETFASIHIVGTNGKGSTAAFLKSILIACGYTTGLMTSPHLIDFRERIEVNNRWITWEALSELVREIRTTLPEENFLSYFEMLTLVGFEYFSKVGVDVAVVEAGMGGRFDATNVLKPQVAVITPISFDHEAYLGDTLEKIAREKCGILKPEQTVVSAPQPPEARKVIEETCKRLSLPLFWADPEQIRIPLSLNGEHQKTNAACALLAARALIGESLMDQVAINALQNTKWPGRLEYLPTQPRLLVDGAHNPAGIETVARFLIENHSRQKIHFLLGVLNDKNFREMLKPLLPLAESFFCLEPKTPRALPAKELAEILKTSGKPVTMINKPLQKAIGDILRGLPSDDLLVATGSLYMVGELLACFPKPDQEG